MSIQDFAPGGAFSDTLGWLIAAGPVIAAAPLFALANSLVTTAGLIYWPFALWWMDTMPVAPWVHP
jgi:hypothetical protein